MVDRLYDLIFVRPPSDSYTHCVSTNPARNTIDITLAKQQHKNYVSLLREAENLEVIELPPLQNQPDSVFLTDPAILGVRHCIIGRFGEQSRRRENQTLANDLRQYKNKVGTIARIQPPGTMEGGDILVTDTEIFIGHHPNTRFPRTNLEGIRQLKRLSKLKVQPVLSNTFHLLCACSYLRDKEILLAPDVLSPDSFPGYKFVLVPQEEIYASEALYLGDGKVLIPAGYPQTSRHLRNAGYTPVEVELSEFWKGDGGVSCLSAPVFKML